MTFVEAIDTIRTMASRADRLKHQLQAIDPGNVGLGPSDKSRAIADLDDMACRLRLVEAHFMREG